jgi:hypothetical protein
MSDYQAEYTTKLGAGRPIFAARTYVAQAKLLIAGARQQLNTHTHALALDQLLLALHSVGAALERLSRVEGERP